jgi:hypothetical protein
MCVYIYITHTHTYIYMYMYIYIYTWIPPVKQFRNSPLTSVARFQI